MATKLQILQDHCHDFERELQSSPNTKHAEQIREQICQKLGESCKSEMMREMLTEHARELIRRKFTPKQASTASS